MEKPKKRMSELEKYKKDFAQKSEIEKKVAHDLTIKLNRVLKEIYQKPKEKR